MAAFFKKHPHVRGEDRHQQPETKAALETPPRAWGRQAEPKKQEEYLRNTPTCVGKTISPMNGRICVKKHPHVRGEDPRAADASCE